ncbi:molybdopterin-dependent oxidoreductase [Thermithiobacillus tepidarius DSM 3134]|uniref:SorA family sulfite dehydrogenase catalytic subunit n=1 Tax=Thermithiobacillus tepidarius TaxID=929 RepID=UPI000413AE03|nr:molybdopterin-dependent oxidoreductase [Thermithiobacillus tepidarius]
MTPEDPSGPVRHSRRDFLRLGAALGGLSLLGRLPAGLAQEAVDLPFANGHRPLVSYPQKRPLMLLTSRPVQLETPFHVFNDGILTPNDAFFVRWHLARVPTQVDARSFRVRVHGRVKRRLSLSLHDLQRDFEPVELIAVNQCSGNSRGFFMPRVPGGQWGNGAMGNARWKGVRLRDVLQRAGLEPNAVQVRLNGLDRGVMEVTPDFIKALDLDVALGPDVLLAYEMNGEPLPLLNGFPLRLVVPGWYATYWVKMLDDIEVINHEDQNFWMKTAYRIPATPSGGVEPGQKDFPTVPINRMTVRSFITSLADGAVVRAGQPVVVRGIAFDGGFGIRRVRFSSDGGRRWEDATLGRDYGNYSFRPWEVRFTPQAGRDYTLQCQAENQRGETQPASGPWNPGGYLRNAIETVRVRAV